jgi:transposase
MHYNRHAEAICEAVQRPSMRFVPIKAPESQAGLVLHRTRHLFVRQLTAVGNSIRAHMAEFEIVAPVGRQGLDALVAIINDGNDHRMLGLVRTCLIALSIQLDALKQQIRILDKRLMSWHRTNETCRRLDAKLGVTLDGHIFCDSAGDYYQITGPSRCDQLGERQHTLSTAGRDAPPRCNSSRPTLVSTSSSC